MSQAARKLSVQELMPSDMRTAQWDRVPLWIRERSFFMASVDKAEILDAFRNEATAIAAGARGASESRKRLRSMLHEIDYGPQPGQEHTIKDLRTFRRMEVTLETNVAMARGYAAHERQEKAKGVFPAKRMVRLEPRREERDWDARWVEAGGGSTPGTTGPDEKVALIDHDIWRALSRFGTPYPPFDFGSGMGVLPVRRDEAEALGIFEDLTENEIREALTPHAPSPNEGLEVRPQVNSRALRKALAEEMQGFGKWEGDRFLFTDPNGTRRMTGKDLAEVWDQGLPLDPRSERGESWPMLQREALIDWVETNENFEKAFDRDKWEDLQRLMGRLENQKQPDALFRGLKIEPGGISKFLHTVEAGGYQVREQFPADSWTASSSAAERFAATGGRKWSVILEMPSPDHNAFKDVSGLVRQVAPDVPKTPAAPLVTESEWLLRRDWAFKARKVVRDDASRTIRIELENQR